MLVLRVMQIESVHDNIEWVCRGNIEFSNLIQADVLNWTDRSMASSLLMTDSPKDDPVVR